MMCTRVFNSKNPTCLATARNMDWSNQFETSFFGFRANQARNGLINPLQATTEHNNRSGSAESAAPACWISQYASITITSEMLVCDGMNEKGLMINALWDNHASYATSNPQKRTELAASQLCVYILDNFATVQEAAKGLTDADFFVMTGTLPNSGGMQITAHVSISDDQGGSAIVEIEDGKIVLYCDPAFQVMTNQPGYAKQIELNAYWRWVWNADKNNPAPTYTIPGGASSVDRFQRAACKLANVTTANSINEAAAQAMSIAAACSTPIGSQKTSTNAQPNDAQTDWTSLCIHEQRHYYFASRHNPGTCFVDLPALLKGQLQAGPDGHDIVTLPLVTTYDDFAGRQFTNILRYGDITKELQPWVKG